MVKSVVHTHQRAVYKKQRKQKITARTSGNRPATPSVELQCSTAHMQRQHFIAAEIVAPQTVNAHELPICMRAARSPAKVLLHVCERLLAPIAQATPGSPTCSHLNRRVDKTVKSHKKNLDQARRGTRLIEDGSFPATSFVPEIKVILRATSAARPPAQAAATGLVSTTCEPFITQENPFERTGFRAGSMLQQTQAKKRLLVGMTLGLGRTKDHD